VSELARYDVHDDQIVVNEASQAGFLSSDLVVAQDIVRRLVVDDLLVVLMLTDNMSMTMVKNIAADHALDVNIGCELVKEQFVSHLFTGSCVINGSLGTGGCACTAIAKGFPDVPSLLDYMIGIVSSPSAKKLTRSLLLKVLSILNIDTPLRQRRRDQLVTALTRHCRGSDSSNMVHDMFLAYERLTTEQLVDLVSSHGIDVQGGLVCENLREILMSHLSEGCCAFGRASNPGCLHVCNEHLLLPKDVRTDKRDLQCHLLKTVGPQMAVKPLRRLLRIHSVDYNSDDSLSVLRRKLSNYVSRLEKGKQHEDSVVDRDLSYRRREVLKDEVRRSWPRKIGEDVKKRVREMFREQTSSECLARFVCACCAEECYVSEQVTVSSSELNLNVLRRPDCRVDDEDDRRDPWWLDADCRSPPMPHRELLFKDVLLDERGFSRHSDGNIDLSLCQSCFSSVNNKRLPSTAIANHLYLGPVPDELKDLTVIEEAMIARCRAKCWVVHLKEENANLHLPHSQRGIKGHIIIYPQNPSAIARVLPPSLDEVVTPVCVLFVGSSPPTQEWLRTKASPLIIRRERVRDALRWLKQHNRLYKDITIDHDTLDRLECEQMLPVHIQHVPLEKSEDMLTSRYDTRHLELPECVGSEAPFQNVVVSDVDVHAPSNELRAAALRHVKQQGGAYVEIPHGPAPVNEFSNPDLFPMIYPTLFPYGLGGFEQSVRMSKIGMSSHAKHLFSLADRRFQEHYSFMFSVFNVLQRRELLLHTSLRVKRSNFDSAARKFASVSPEIVHIVSERVAHGDTETAHNDEERKVLRLMSEVKAISTHVRGSSAAKMQMRNEIRAMMMEHGLPNFYITINPADVYNPIVKLLGGADIDVDNLLPEDVPEFMQQSILVAKNPVVAAKFFNLYMKAFVNCVLGYDASGKDIEGGILGLVKGYYGCVEAQGRGTLHCHMMIWLDGGLNSDEIKHRIIEQGDDDFAQRLLAFLDDSISNCIPLDPDSELSIPSSRHHPCSVRGISEDTAMDVNIEIAREKDLHHIVSACQKHRHTATCFKYWKGPPDPKQCRFDLDEKRFRPTSYFDKEEGEVCLRCLDGMVNNFNETILELVRCNMDIKFISSGASAKAILYYITDYITKSQLKAHVAYAALRLAVDKLGQYCPGDDDLTVRAKRLLQKCAHAMISHQELSAQQVSSYLLDYEDHFTSHAFNNLYWTSFERHINQQQPSLECEPDRTQDIQENCWQANEEVDEMTYDDERQENERNWNEHMAEDNEDEDEVGVSVDHTGNFIEKPSQYMDYIYRGRELNELSLWDFVAQTEKIKHKLKNMTEDECETQSIDTWSDMSVSQAKERPKVPFLGAHPQSESHVLRIRLVQDRVVPVPIGPRIPRRDQPKIYPRYCRLMIMLFKPWRISTDLRSSGQSWEEAFAQFRASAHSRSLQVMNNMQMLHECRDSRDDHFADRLARMRRTSQRQSNDTQPRTNDEFGNDEAILEHLEAIDACRSNQKMQASDAVLDCLHHAEMSGIWKSRDSVPVDNQPECNLLSKEIHISPTDLDLENIWLAAYEERRDNWKKKRTQNDPSNDSNVNEPSTSLMNQTIKDGTEFRDAPVDSIESNDVHNMTIHSGIATATSSVKDSVNIDDMISEFTLNTEQARAFRIVAEHSLQVKPEPLRMFIGGAGGTGKSRVINTLKEFFHRRNQSRRFRLASYTGVAAKNISGMTLHSALSIGQRTTRSARTKTNRDLIAMWEGVDYLFIDEISMIGCNFLLQISEALTEAKGKTTPFGGMNLITAGDFDQLPPVGQPRLFSHVNTHRVATTQGQNAVLGKLLWLSIDTVVILNEIRRQQGKENQPFVELLSRLRHGNCTTADYTLLNTRQISNVKPNWNDGWRDAPVIVSNNDVKDAFNIQATADFARRTNRELHWYYCSDVQAGKEISDHSLCDHLNNLHSGLTNQRLGRIPLVIGMPVIIGYNFDVEGGIVNGCQGILKAIRYTTDNEGRRHARSCIIHSSDTICEDLPHLHSGEIVALENSVELRFSHPHSHKQCKIIRTQVPVLPAFAMTTHKAQGRTLPNAIIDIQSCRGTEAPYVMASRVTSLDGLLILRPFNINKIRSRPSEDSRKEERRLECLRLQTILIHGTAEEKVNTEKTLRREFNDTTTMPSTNMATIEENAEAPERTVQHLDILQNHIDHTFSSSYVSRTMQVVD